MDSWPEVEAWHRAVNARVAEAAVAVATPDVRLGGPRGSAEGSEVLRRWVEEAGLRLDPVACHAVSDRVVVVEEDATWPHRPGPSGAPVRVATVYAVRDGRVAAVLRHDGLAAALDAAGRLSEPP
jgi:hypothetical protein